MRHWHPKDLCIAGIVDGIFIWHEIGKSSSGQIYDLMKWFIILLPLTFKYMRYWHLEDYVQPPIEFYETLYQTSGDIATYWG